MPVPLLLRLLLALLLATSAKCADPELVADPVLDYASHGRLARGVRIARCELDLVGDGTRQMFITSSNAALGKPGYAWAMYAPVAEGYRRVGGLTLIFGDNLFAVGEFHMLARRALMTYQPGGGQSGLFIAYVFDRNEMNIVEEYRRALRLSDDRPGDIAFFEKYFGKGPPFKVPKIEWMNAEDLAQKYGLKLANPDHRTP